MMHYAQSTTCRRQTLRTYFAEPLGDPCGTCDNCVNHVEAAAPAAPTQTTIAPTYLEQLHASHAQAAPESPFHTGDTVTHPQFGTGIVNAVEGDTLTINFGRRNLRRLKASFVHSVHES
jgi:ATP-dependent DNA helicase RecQ